MNKKVAFYTLGCKLNYSETSTIGRLFNKAGFDTVDFTNTPDVFVINISSPNTQGLRQLQTAENMTSFLQPLVDYKVKNKLPQPLLIKLSPDMNEVDLMNTLEISAKLGIDGWILTNTTLSRPQENRFPTEGGLSGAFLTDRSRGVLKDALQHIRNFKNNHLVVSAGGIMNEQEAYDRLEMGAHLLQVYSALIFSAKAISGSFVTAVAKFWVVSGIRADCVK